LGLVLVGAVFTLVPAGAWRRRAVRIAFGALVTLAAGRVYLGADHLTDALCGLAFAWALPAAVFRLATPEEVFPLTYRRGARAHLELTGTRREAIERAVAQQLGLDVVALERFGLGGSAGSTPLRLRLRGSAGSPDTTVFGKLYALSHLRSDRWYKLTRTVLYGRLEDEKPFSTVRRLVEYEDHLLRLLRDAGLPTPQPLGFVEITPEREYLILMEYFDGAVEIGSAVVDERVIDSGLSIVRKLWDAGVAHRDIKPSNVLVRESTVLLIDVAFATVRPTPWRQAVDLANMMLTLALQTTPEKVYERAVRIFAPEDIAEAFAATRSVTIPSQLRSRLKADRRDLPASFRHIAPPRPPVPVQLWSARRVAVTLAVFAAAANSPVCCDGAPRRLKARGSGTCCTPVAPGRRRHDDRAHVGFARWVHVRVRFGTGLSRGSAARAGGPVRPAGGLRAVRGRSANGMANNQLPGRNGGDQL
jgi:tRNA A-37 threonylcarbamoyl transferase component Bud32